MTTHQATAVITHCKPKWSFGKTLLILCGICSAYAWFIPTKILTEYPGLLPFVNAMESALPAIKGFARASPVSEVVRFYYATMWIVFPFLYLFVRVRWMVSFAPQPTFSAPKKNGALQVLLGVVLCVFVAVLVFFVMGFMEARDTPVKPILVSGRGNALFAALSLNPIVFGIASAFMWVVAALVIEFAIYGVRHLIKGRPPV